MIFDRLNNILTCMNIIMETTDQKCAVYSIVFIVHFVVADIQAVSEVSSRATIYQMLIRQWTSLSKHPLYDVTRCCIYVSQFISSYFSL